MTPCEKRGYKVGDKFEVVGEHHAFEKGTVLTLKSDDGSSNPLFTGARDDGRTEGFCGLHKIKPVSQRTTKPISKSKRQLAQLLIEAGVTKFPKGANWAAQGGGKGRVGFCVNKQIRDGVNWTTDSDSLICLIEVAGRIPNWHQTVLSRDEFDQIVAETVVQVEPSMTEDERCIQEAFVPEPTAAPTLDQLIQDWRNADDYAQRKQTEADEAASMRDDRWQAVQARAGEMGVTGAL